MRVPEAELGRRRARGKACHRAEPERDMASALPDMGVSETWADNYAHFSVSIFSCNLTISLSVPSSYQNSIFSSWAPLQLDMAMWLSFSQGEVEMVCTISGPRLLRSRSASSILLPLLPASWGGWQGPRGLVGQKGEGVWLPGKPSECCGREPIADQDHLLQTVLQVISIFLCTAA